MTRALAILAVAAAGAILFVAAAAAKSAAPPWKTQAEWYIWGAFTGAPYPLKSVTCKVVGPARVACTVVVSGYAPYLVCSSATFTIKQHALTGASFPKPKKCQGRNLPGA